MGAACCIAAKDRTITNGSPVETLQRHARYSPTWSFRWDNRGRVAGEETPANWLNNDGGSANDQMGSKTGTSVETAFASEEGSPLDSFRSLAWHKSPVSERNGRISRPPSSDQAISQNIVEVKESRGSPTVSYPSAIKLSPSVPSVSSMSASPLSSQSHLLHPNSTPSRWHHRSPRHRLLRQVSDSRIPEYKSPTFSISEGNESTRVSNGGSSDNWSIPALAELTTTRRERWSFDSETFTRSSELNSRSPSFELQTCGICTKLLIERSKIMSTDLAVVSVLTCGHVYHGECLETMTPEIDKYDPACPVCTFGEKRALKMSEKVLKSELDSKARKRFRKRVVDSDVSGDITHDGYRKSGVLDGKGPKMSSSSSMKSSIGKPFLRRHFSFGSKTSRSLSDNQSTPRKGFFWARSSKN